MELEIERDENQKNLDFVKQMREKDKHEFKSKMEKVEKQKLVEAEELQN